MRTRFCLRKRRILANTLSATQKRHPVGCLRGREREIQNSNVRVSIYRFYSLDWAHVLGKGKPLRSSNYEVFLRTKEPPTLLRGWFFCWRRERDSNSRSVISRTHDFQSCALDQLSHLSVRPVYSITLFLKCQAFF